MLLMGKSTISMAIFNSYFDITRGYFFFNRNGMMILTLDKGTAPIGSSKSQPPKAATSVAKKNSAEIYKIYWG